MLLFIKNFFKDLYLTMNCWVERHSLKIAGGLVFVIILLLLFGCAGNPAVKADMLVSENGESYVSWDLAPSYIAKDFLEDDGWGLMDGLTFEGKHGLPCHLMKIDRPVDGICDHVVIICETGETDDRHGPGTPLVVAVGTIECAGYDDMAEIIRENF